MYKIKLGTKEHHKIYIIKAIKKLKRASFEELLEQAKIKQDNTDHCLLLDTEGRHHNKMNLLNWNIRGINSVRKKSF